MKTRVIHTKFWTDTYIQGLRPTERLLFIFLLSNEQVNMTGAYEMNFGYMQYCTGIGQADIITTLEKFQQDRKIAYVDGYVVLLNHLKYQNYSKGNENQQKAFEREKSLLSDSVRDFIDNKGESTSPQLVGNQLPTIHKSEIRNKKTKNIKQKTEIINSEIEKSFEEFWEVYPRKIKKQDAKEKYVLLVGQDNTLVDKILKGLNEQLPTMEKQERQFIPHPTTWLNGRRWEDVVEEKGGGKWI
jgi:hypothetical protein